MAVLVGWMGYEFGVNIVTLVLQILIGGGFFCLATMGYMLISKDELWTIGISSILKKKK